MLSCYPELCTPEDYHAIMSDFKNSEKVSNFYLVFNLLTGSLRLLDANEIEISLWKRSTVRDLISELVQYSNGPKQFARRMVCYSSHDLNGELKVCYSGQRVFD